MCIGAARSATATAQSSPSKPKTVFQCEKAFKRGSSLRAACIKRAASQKPGTSCKYPLVSNQTLGGPSGDTKDFSVNLKYLVPPENGTAVPMTVAIEVIVHNPHIRICGAVVTDLGFNPATGRYEASRQHVYHLAISPGGGISSSLTLPSYVSIVGKALARLE
jgi:hypothetical protein